MTKAPTKRAIPAKASRKYWMKLANSLTSSLSSCASACAERTWASAGRIGWISSISCSGSFRPSRDGDRVDLPLAVEELLGRSEVEDGERCRAQ